MICNVKVAFYNGHVVVTMYPHKLTNSLLSSLYLRLHCLFPSAWLAFVVQVFDRIWAVSTEVGSLTLYGKTSPRYIGEFECAMRNEA